MMCCRQCPFTTDAVSPWHDAVPAHWRDRCAPSRCVRDGRQEARLCPDPCSRLRWRCLQDRFVIAHLPRRLSLAAELAPYTLDTAVLSRDRLLLTALFHLADPDLSSSLQQRLRDRWPHARSLLDPTITPAPLAPAVDGPATRPGNRPLPPASPTFIPAPSPDRPPATVAALAKSCHRFRTEPELAIPVPVAATARDAHGCARLPDHFRFTW